MVPHYNCVRESAVAVCRLYGLYSITSCVCRSRPTLCEKHSHTPCVTVFQCVGECDYGSGRTKRIYTYAIL